MAQVTIYTRPLCGYCVAARRLLERVGASIHTIDVAFSPASRQEMQNRSGRNTFPQIFIGETHVGGFSELCALHDSGGLDTMLKAPAGK